MTKSQAAGFTIVLVHGAFVDGCGWEGVYDLLRRDGHTAVVVQTSARSLGDDVGATRRVIMAQTGRVLLVGHSYGGVVITAAGNDPRVAGLVYVAALVPDQGETAGTLLQHEAAATSELSTVPTRDGLLMIDPAKFRSALAGDVEPAKAAFMAATQLPWGVDALHAKVQAPAWRARPSWYLVASDDRTIPPPLQRFMSRRAGSTTIEASGSHAIHVSKPIVVVAFIEQAAAELTRER